MTAKRTREKPIVDIRALDYRWVEMANSTVPGFQGSTTPEAKAAWRLQYRREGDTEWSPLRIVTINAPPPEET